VNTDPPDLERRNTPSNIHQHVKMNNCAKFGALFHSVTFLVFMVKVSLFLAQNSQKHRAVKIRNFSPVRFLQFWTSKMLYFMW